MSGAIRRSHRLSSTWSSAVKNNQSLAGRKTRLDALLSTAARPLNAVQRGSVKSPSSPEGILSPGNNVGETRLKRNREKGNEKKSTRSERDASRNYTETTGCARRKEQGLSSLLISSTNTRASSSPRQVAFLSFSRTDHFRASAFFVGTPKNKRNCYEQRGQMLRR